MNVLHAKQPIFSPPSEPFVLSRVLNPVCRRPVPVVTQGVTDFVLKNKDLEIYAADNLTVLLRKADALFRRTLRWSPYYLWALSIIRPHVIHAHFSFSAEPLIFPLRLLKIPLVVSFYGVETKRFLDSQNKRCHLNKVMKAAKVITCLSYHMMKELYAAGLPMEKVRLIRLGVDTDFFKGIPKSWRPGETMEILSIARLHPEKGLNFLLLALKLLDERGFIGWRLRIIGSGEHKSVLKDMAHQLSISDRVIFAGTMPPIKVVQELQNAHIMVLPSLHETQGVALQEAQATATPVIASSVGGIPEGVLDEQTGFLVPPKSPEAIADRILHFVAIPSLFLEMGDAARQYVVTHFSKAVEYQQLEEVYRLALRIK